MAIDTWVEEFLFRGKPAVGPGSEREPTFQVRIAQRETSELSPSGYGPIIERVVTPEVAESVFDLDLTTLVAGINAAAIDRIAELEAQVIALEGQLAAVQAQESE